MENHRVYHERAIPPAETQWPYLRQLTGLEGEANAVKGYLTNERDARLLFCILKRIRRTTLVNATHPPSALSQSRR